MKGLGSLASRAVLLAAAVPWPALAASCGVDKDGHPIPTSGVLGQSCPTAANPVYALLVLFIKYAVGVLGLVMVLMIVIAGLQYVLSEGNPDSAKAAKDRVRNALTGLVLFALMFGILQVLIPEQLF